MAESQGWMVVAIVIVTVIVFIYFSIQNLHSVITQCERDSSYASGRMEAKIENLEQLVRVVIKKLHARDVLLRQLHRDAKKQNKRSRKLCKHV